MKIVVLAGGLSPERDVSLSSGALIANALVDNGHEVMLLDLFLGCHNQEIPPEYRTAKEQKKFFYQIPETEPDLKEISKGSAGMVGEGVLDLCKTADVVFLALHGSVGENGQLQALFVLYSIRYTGTGYTGSLLAMDKDLSKRLMRNAGIPTANWKYFQLDGGDCDTAGIDLPCVIKPCCCGSSIGVTIVESSEQLEHALQYAGKYEKHVMIEDKIEGREFSVGILGGKALPVIEIIPKTGFYDYKNKYQTGMTEEICPAALTPAETDRLQSHALAVHKALRLGFYSRIDFILNSSGEAYCLEANTLPGMTPTSLLPREALAAGISYHELCERIARGV